MISVRDSWLLATRTGALVGALALSACLHNAGNYEMAQAAQKSFEEAKIGASLDGEKELSSRMGEAEQVAVRREVEAERDLALATILDGNVQLFDEDVNSLLADAVGNAELAAQVRSAVQGRINAEENLQADMHRVEGLARKLGLSLPPKLACPLPTELDLPSELKVVFGNYKQSCDAYTRAKAAYDAVLSKASGSLGSVNQALAAEEKRLSGAKADAEKCAEDYKVALDAYKALLAESDPAKAPKEKLDEAAGKVKAALDTLKKLSDAQALIQLPTARIEELEARQAAVALSVQNVLTNTPRDDSILEIALAAGLQASRLDAQKHLPVLLLEAEQLRGALETAKTQARFAELKRALLERERDALMVQLDQLLETKRSLDELKPKVGLTAIPSSPPAAVKPKAAAGKGAAKVAEPVAPAPPAKGSTCPADDSVIKCFNAIDETGQMRMAEALLHYSNAWTLGISEAHGARWMRLAAIHDQAIEQSAVAMQRWETVLRIPIAEVVKLHAAGWKPAEVAALISALQAAGVGVIAGGVLAK